jgi:hypothetical protein
LASFFKCDLVVAIEFVLIINLAWFTENQSVKDVAFDFAALAVIAEFDDAMINVFNMCPIMSFVAAEIPFERLQVGRRRALDPEEERHFRLIEKQLLDFQRAESLLKDDVDHDSKLR